MGNIFKKEAIKAYKFIKKGGVILYPTETIWGLGCDASNCQAVEKIYNIKKRSVKTPMLSLVKNISMIKDLTDTSENTVQNVLDGLTETTSIIYPSGKNICRYILSDDKSVGLRLTENKFCLELISLMNKPLVSTSANIHKEAFPKSFLEINDDILKQVDYVVNLPTDNWSTKPSSVIKLDEFGNICKIR
tara:strand:+ start:232 stop:801 length:570 start_codon:yes stop_codon:yes gene_type:complete